MTAKPKSIREQLSKRGFSLAEVGRLCGVGRQMVSAVCLRKKESKEVQFRVACLLGQPMDDLFPPKGA